MVTDNQIMNIDGHLSIISAYDHANQTSTLKQSQTQIHQTTFETMLYILERFIQ